MPEDTRVTVAATRLDPLDHLYPGFRFEKEGKGGTATYYERM